MKSVLQGMRNTANYISENQDVEGGTVTVRPSATAILAIDSDDRYSSYAQRRSSPTYPFSFNIQKNSSLMNGFFKRLAITEFRMNWTLPNIAKAWGNNQIGMTYKLGAAAPVTVTLTIADAFYGAEELARALTTQIQVYLPTALVSTSTGTDPTPDEWYIFFAGTGNSFYFSPVANNPFRQLIDMLNIFNPLGTTLQATFTTGIPTLRPTDYIDLICNQLTYNQELKDTTSLPNSRDMLSRVYLDIDTPSQSLTQTNNYSGTVIGQLVGTITAATGSGNIAVFTLNASPGAIETGAYCVVSGIGGAVSYNGSGRIIAETIVSPFTVTVEMTTQLSGTPTFSGASKITLYDKIETISVPQMLWDDRINGVTPFVLYRQYPVPKFIRWNNKMPIGNLTFEMYDDQGRNIQNIWNSAYAPSSYDAFSWANSFSWNATILVSED